MSKKPKPSESAKEQSDFGLAKPSAEIEALRADQAKGSSKVLSDVDDHEHYISTEKHLHDAEAKYKAMGWKGVDEEEEEELEEGFGGGKKEPIPEDELDMTPMVDVTFLLLIFFMVTASFSLQKSIQQPPASSEAPSNNPVDVIVEEDYVEVVIDQNNNYYVTSRDQAEAEAPSEMEMRSRVKDAKENSSATRLIIKAHLDCKHKMVVTAWDAGINVGMNKIEIKTMEQDY